MEMPYFEIQNQYLDKWHPEHLCVCPHILCYVSRAKKG